LANLPEVKLRAYLSKPLERYTDKTITDPAKLRERLIKIRRQGYDWTFDEFEEGLVATSAPIFNNMGRVVATLYISAPTYRFPLENKKQITRWLVDLTQRATQVVCGQAYVVS
jgi:DNA-binding IclR family transcriptional regulator